MLTIVCNCIRKLGRAEKIIRILTAIRVAVFVGALVYTAVTAVSMIKKKS